MAKGMQRVPSTPDCALQSLAATRTVHTAGPVAGSTGGSSSLSSSCVTGLTLPNVTLWKANYNDTKRVVSKNNEEQKSGFPGWVVLATGRNL